MGRLVIKSGKRAQWIAHASEVAIPRASRFIFDLIKAAKLKQCNKVAKYMLG